MQGPGKEGGAGPGGGGEGRPGRPGARAPNSRLYSAISLLRAVPAIVRVTAVPSASPPQRSSLPPSAGTASGAPEPFRGACAAGRAGRARGGEARGACAAGRRGAGADSGARPRPQPESWL